MENGVQLTHEQLTALKEFFGAPMGAMNVAQMHNNMAVQQHLQNIQQQQLLNQQMQNQQQMMMYSQMAKNKEVDLESFFKNTEGKHKVRIDLDKDIDANKVKKVAYDNKNKAMSEIKKFIDEIYDNWYIKDDMDNGMKYLTKHEVKKLAIELFDAIAIEKGSKGIRIEYWINAFSSHKKSKDFFGNHCITIIFTIDPETFKIIKIRKPMLEG